MKKFLHFLDRAEEYLLVGSLVFTVILVFVQVVMRYVFQNSLSWSEELARFIFVFQTWLGASLGVKYRRHIRVEIIFNFISPRVRQYLEIVVLCLCLGLSLFLVINGVDLLQQLFARKAYSPGLHLPMGYAYATVQIGCAVMSVRLLQELYKTVVAIGKGGE